MGYFKQFCVGISGAFFALLASAFLTSAHAAVVTWYLNDVTFDDGGRAEGSFGFDAETNAYSDIAITTYNADGSTVAEYDILYSTQFNNNQSFYALISSNSNDYTATPMLFLQWGTALAGSSDLESLIIPLNFGSVEAECDDATCNFANPIRLVETGYITSYIVSEVPLPAALPLFIAGLAGIGALGRRRKAAV